MAEENQSETWTCRKYVFLYIVIFCISHKKETFVPSVNTSVIIGSFSVLEYQEGITQCVP